MKTSKIVVLLLLAALVMAFSPQRCVASLHYAVDPADYIGSLSALDNELVVSDGWIPHDVTGDTKKEDTKISWVITDNKNGTFTYSYTFTVPEKDLSHMIIEVSANFTEDDYTGPSGLISELRSDNTTPTTTWGPTFTGDPPVPDKPNPYMPGSIPGIKVESFADGPPYSWSITITSTRVPMWGNFYAVDGEGPIPGGGTEWATAWNTGFDGSGSDFIPVPDTIIPVPGAVLLGILGLGVAGLKLRKYA